MRYRECGYPRRPSVGDTRRKAEKKLKELRKKKPDIRPIVIEGRKIAKTWWGISWNTNLERYADYSNRIGRGRSYVRNGSVLDLHINQGKVKSLVQGTRSKPYSVDITINRIGETQWKQITSTCEGELESLQELLMGHFPKALGEIFTAKGTGLFPSPKEIKFSCSCPDWASMCKHVAAVLYGIGARLDKDPKLFFTLRDVEVNELISQAVEEKTKELLRKAEKKSDRVIDEVDISEVFGIELEDKEPSPLSTLATSPPVSLPHVPATEAIEKIVRRSRKGVDVTTLRKRTGFDNGTIYSAIQRLKKRGKVKNKSRGIYICA